MTKHEQPRAKQARQADVDPADLLGHPLGVRSFPSGPSTPFSVVAGEGVTGPAGSPVTERFKKNPSPSDVRSSLSKMERGSKGRRSGSRSTARGTGARSLPPGPTFVVDPADPNDSDPQTQPGNEGSVPPDLSVGDGPEAGPGSGSGPPQGTNDGGSGPPTGSGFGGDGPPGSSTAGSGPPGQ